MTVNVGGLIMVRKEGWLAENPLSSINPTVPALLKRGRKQLCSRVGPFECTAVTQAFTTEKRGSSFQKTGELVVLKLIVGTSNCCCSILGNLNQRQSQSHINHFYPMNPKLCIISSSAVTSRLLIPASLRS